MPPTEGHAMPGSIGPGTPEGALRATGQAPLAIEALLTRILGYTVWGDYQYSFRFVSYCDRDGTIKGTNNAGSYNTGRWQADPQTGTFNVSWNQSWIPASLRAYEVGDTLQFFNQNSGLWHMSFDRFEAGKQPLTL